MLEKPEKQTNLLKVFYCVLDECECMELGQIVERKEVKISKKLFDEINGTNKEEEGKKQEEEKTFYLTLQSRQAKDCKKKRFKIIAVCDEEISLVTAPIPKKN